jgi:tRNA threonylcarbamoyladenosine biosynthesis protein TsaE
MPEEQTITSHSPQETIELGTVIGRQLKGGEVIAIVGPLGSGKTHLIKGIAAGAGATDTRAVNSPTFVIINQYAGRFDIYHIDAYRIDSIAEFEMLGFDDLCYPESVVLIEWADKVEAILGSMDPIRIDLSHADKTSRIILIRNTPKYLNVR